MPPLLWQPGLADVLISQIYARAAGADQDAIRIRTVHDMCHSRHMKRAALWRQTRGLERVLTRENSVSDLLQYLSDCDPEPWKALVGFAPVEIVREALGANYADLRLTATDGRVVVIEVKLGHLMREDQQQKYEALAGQPALYLAALAADHRRVARASSSSWKFLSLVDLFDAWQSVDDNSARSISIAAAEVLRQWDTTIASVFTPTSAPPPKPLSVLDQKFLARVVTRRIAADLQDMGRAARAAVTSGGGLPIIQAWAPAIGDKLDQAFIAEVRWSETEASGELRFGVDFAPLAGEVEGPDLRRAAFELATAMTGVIHSPRLQQHVAGSHPNMAALLSRRRPDRPNPRGDWDEVILTGFKASPLDPGRKNSRRLTNPGFYGDGTLRFQAIVDIDFEQASATNIVTLLDATLTYLSINRP